MSASLVHVCLWTWRTYWIIQQRGKWYKEWQRSFHPDSQDALQTLLLYWKLWAAWSTALSKSHSGSYTDHSARLITSKLMLTERCSYSFDWCQLLCIVPAPIGITTCSGLFLCFIYALHVPVFHFIAKTGVYLYTNQF